MSRPWAAGQYRGCWTKGELLGSGSFGAVHLGQLCVEDGAVRAELLSRGLEYVALKVVRAGYTADPRDPTRLFHPLLWREAVNNEIRIMRKVNDIESPIFAKLVDVWDNLAAGDEVTFVMEYLRGGDLLTRLNAGSFQGEHDGGVKHSFSERNAAAAFRSLVQGVARLHAHNIVHLDIKLENLVCCDVASDDIKLLDFGHAVELPEGMPVAFSRRARGTKMYSAPESTHPKGLISRASDVYSLGVVLDVLLHGSYPEPMGPGGAYPVRKESSLSESSYELISSMVNVDPAERPSCDEILRHRWFDEARHRDVNLRNEDYLFNLRDYVNRVKEENEREKKDLLAQLGLPPDSKFCAGHVAEIRTCSTAAGAAGAAGGGADADGGPSASFPSPRALLQTDALSEILKNIRAEFENAVARKRRRVDDRSSEEQPASSFFEETATEGAAEEADSGNDNSEAALTETRSAIGLDSFKEVMRSLKLDMLALDGVFRLFDTSRDGKVDFQEIEDALKLALQGDLDFIYRIIDTSGDGQVQRSELAKFLELDPKSKLSKWIFRQLHTTRGGGASAASPENESISFVEFANFFRVCRQLLGDKFFIPLLKSLVEKPIGFLDHGNPEGCSSSCSQTAMETSRSIE